MTIKELIEQLQEISDEHGDYLEVKFNFFDSDAYPINLIYLCVNPDESEYWVELSS